MLSRHLSGGSWCRLYSTTIKRFGTRKKTHRSESTPSVNSFLALSIEKPAPRYSRWTRISPTPMPMAAAEKHNADASMIIPIRTCDLYKGYTFRDGKNTRKLRLCWTNHTHSWRDRVLGLCKILCGRTLRRRTPWNWTRNHRGTLYIRV